MNHVVVLLSGFLCLSVVLLLFPVLRRKRKRNRICQALFFPDKNQKNAHTLLNIISSSQQQLDICVYCLTGQVFLDTIISVHSRGVVVRVITDNEQDSSTQIFKLRKSGIQVRTNSSSYFMHHKFSIIDRKIVLTGSLNWTAQGIHGNHENVVVSNETEYLKGFSEQFEKLWELHAPY